MISIIRRSVNFSSPPLWVTLLFLALFVDSKYDLGEELRHLDSRLLSQKTFIFVIQGLIFFATPILILLATESSLVGFRVSRRVEPGKASKRKFLWWWLGILTITLFWSCISGLSPLEWRSWITTGILDLLVVWVGVTIDLKMWKLLVASFWSVVFLIHFKFVVVATSMASYGIHPRLLTFGGVYLALIMITLIISALTLYLHRKSHSYLTLSRITTLRFHYPIALLLTVTLVILIVSGNMYIIRELKLYPDHRPLPTSSSIIRTPTGAASGQTSIPDPTQQPSKQAPAETLGGTPSEEKIHGVTCAILRLGSAWTVSMPLIVLALLLLQQVTVGQLRSPEKRSGFRALSHRLMNHLSATTSTTVSIMRKHSFRVLVGGVINIALSHILIMDYKPELALKLFSEHSILDPRISSAIYLNVWFGSALMWASPFFENLVLYHDMRRQALSYRIQRELANLSSHFAIAGYGDVGRRVIDLMGQDQTLRIPMTRETREAFLPDGERIRILPRLLIVDKDPKLFAFLDRTGSPPYGLIRLNPIADEADSSGPRVLAPRCAVGICGDINDKHVLEEAKIERSVHYLCLARDDASAFTSLDFLASTERLREKLSVIAVPSTAHLEYYAAAPLRTQTAQIYLEHVRAHRIAQVLSSLYKSNKYKNLTTLLVGSGRELAFIVDAIWKNLPGKVLKKLQDRKIFFLTADPYYTKRLRSPLTGTPSNAEGRRKKRNNPDVFQATTFHLHYFGLTSKGGFREVTIPVGSTEPRVPGEIRKALDAIKPDVLVAAEPHVGQQTALVRSMINASRCRRADTKEMIPTLVIAAETGHPQRAQNLGDAALYYSSFVEAAHEPRDSRHAHGRYPRQFGYRSRDLGLLIGDLNIDVLNDPAQRILGIMRSHVDAQDGKGSPVEMHFCLENRPGALASFFCSAGGQTAPKSVNGSAEMQLSLEGTTIQHDNGNSFILCGGATLKNSHWRGGGRSPVQRALFMPLGGIWKHGREKTLEIVNSLKETFGLTKTPARNADLCLDCPEMVSCPIVSFRLNAEATAHAGRNIWDFLHARDSTEKEPEEDDLNNPEGRMVIYSDGGKELGVIGRILASLILDWVHPKPTATSQTLTNVSYYSEHPCHEDRYMIASIFGNIVANKRQSESREKNERPFKALIIRISTQRKKWHDYGWRLLEFLRLHGGEDWKMESIVGEFSEGKSKKLGSNILVVHCMDVSPLEQYVNWKQIKGKGSTSARSMSQALRAFLGEIEAAIGGSAIECSHISAKTNREWYEVKRISMG